VNGAVRIASPRAGQKKDLKRIIFLLKSQHS
jgi:hypothetical protein